MKRILVALSLFLPLTVAAHADDASKRAKIEQLFTILHIDQVSSQIKNNINNQMQTISTHQFGATPTPEQNKQFGDFKTKVDGLVEQTVGWKAIEPDYIKMYSDAYTEPEIDSFIAFYKSPAGQTLLTKAPELANKSLSITQQHMATIAPQLRQIVTDFVKETTPPARTSPPTLNSLPPSTSTPPPANSTPQPH